MSASTIARWNSIPMVRQDDSLKRPRPDDDEENHAANGSGEDDDISLVSQSSSPAPMDVDESTQKYDEYHRGAEREVITVNTRIKPTNKGFELLAKLGWVEGQSLGLSGDGRVDPVPFYVKNDLTGLGKTSQDVRMIETTVAQRRELDSERQQKETEEQRRAREENVARRTALQSEISSTLRPFYCTLCDKQFRTVTQYDEHTNSYAHHHKARLKDMQANARIFPKEEVDRRKEKERKREEKELRKIAAANGIRMPKAAGVAPLVSPASGVSGTIVEPTAPSDPPRDSGGWVSLSSSSSGFKRSGWASITGSETPPPPPSNDPPPPPSNASPLPPSNDHSQPFVSGGWQSVSPPLPPSSPPAPAKHTAPAFRTGGWTSLNDSSLAQTSVTAPQPMPSSWHSQPRHPSPSRENAPQTSPLLPATVSTPMPAAQPVRSGWQRFKHSGPKRR